MGETRSAKELLAMSLAELEETAYDNYLLSLENFYVKMFNNKVCPMTRQVYRGDQVPENRVF